jgi:hypothetical protein
MKTLRGQRGQFDAAILLDERELAKLSNIS